MATAYPQATEYADDNFVFELKREKDKVRIRFIELREILTGIENKLMKALNDILSSYNSYPTEVKRMNEQKLDIENMLIVNMTVVPTSPPLKTFHEKILQDLNEQLKQLRTPVKPKLVSFVCDTRKLLTGVNESCKLVEKVDYRSKTQSILSVCDTGTGNEKLNSPQSVTVDHNTGNIYVADTCNHCVKVFDSTAKYLLKFGDGKDERKMSHPRGLLIRGNKIFLSHDHCIRVYELNGKFLSCIGSEGSGELQFNFPWGLSTDESNNYIYICDYENNRIQIISENLPYKSQFGKDTLYHPRDITIYKGNIFVLDASNPCLHIYNKNLVLQKSVVIRGAEQQVINPCFFFIDRFGYIIITDYSSNSILILNSEFDFIHKIFVSKPIGITMDEEDRIIVTCHVSKCLQIF